MFKRILTLLTLLASITLIANSADAKGVGFRAGFGLDPDQFVAGIQADAGRALEVGRIYPSADIGIGSDFTILTGNLDFVVSVSPPNARTSFYVGGGPTLAYIDHKATDGDVEIGVSLVGGMKFPMGTKNFYTLEARLGVGDIPDFRLLFGLAFGGGVK